MNEEQSKLIAVLQMPDGQARIEALRELQKTANVEQSAAIQALIDRESAQTSTPAQR